MPKRYLTGGGKRLKNHLKSICYSSNIFKRLKYFTKKLAQFLKPRNEEELSRGAILIEFAVCMPILIILLFYINDLVRIKRYYSQTEFVAQQAANMIQNISQKREDKAININDIKFIYSTAFLSTYPGTTMFYNGNVNGHKLGHYPYLVIFYIKGESEGKASYVWNARAYTYSSSNTSPSAVACDARTGERNWYIVKTGKNVNPSEIHPSPKISQGEVKIIIEASMICKNDPKKVFGCHLITPKAYALGQCTYFPSVAIFTPKPGLFSETQLPQ